MVDMSGINSLGRLLHKSSEELVPEGKGKGIIRQNTRYASNKGFSFALSVPSWTMLERLCVGKLALNNREINFVGRILRFSGCFLADLTYSFINSFLAA